MPDKTPDITITDAKDSAPKKRGRPAGSTNKTPASGPAADVAKAMATLDNAYNMVATGLVMFGLNQSAETWVDSAEQLKATNKDALTASPKVAAYIANAGTAGGAGTLLLTHGMAFAGLAKIVNSELAERRAAREPKQDSYEPSGIVDENRRDPTLIPGL